MAKCLRRIPMHKSKSEIPFLFMAVFLSILSCLWKWYFTPTEFPGSLRSWLFPCLWRHCVMSIAHEQDQENPNNLKSKKSKNVFLFSLFLWYRRLTEVCKFNNIANIWVPLSLHISIIRKYESQSRPLLYLHITGLQKITLSS